MVNILIPMAGLGSRFAEAGYEKPKPFIDVDGEPMIRRVLENLTVPGARYILVARTEHLLREKELVKDIVSDYNAEFVCVSQLTEGTVCTALQARKLFDNDDMLIIANSDQIIEMSLQDFIDDAVRRCLDGSILTFKDHSRDPKWSFAKLDSSKKVLEVKEKEAISDYATVGIYLFKKGSEFVEAAIDMISRNDRVNDEFYTCPVYNYLIKDGKHVGVYNIRRDAMHGIGTPEDLGEYLKTIDV